MLKETAEIIGSRLKKWNLVADDFKVTSARQCTNITFYKYFTTHEDTEQKLVY